MKKRLLSSEIFKRVLSMAIVLVMVLGLIPASAFAADGTTLYLKPGSDWSADGARFAVYYWNGNGGAWTDMSNADSDGIYEAVVSAEYTNIIFCRMNPNTTVNNWDNRWNQTSDLTIPTDGTNLYVIEEPWPESNNWNATGRWETYTPAGEEPEETEPAPAGTYYVAGDRALCGVEWSCNDVANQMTWNGVTGCFEKVYTNVAAGTYNLKVTDGTWDNSWGDNGQNYTFVVSAVCDVTVSFNPNTKTVSVTGDHVGKETGLEITSMHAVGNGSGNWLNGKNWDVTANVMTEVSANVYEITFENVAAGSYEYKFAANASWTHSWGGGGAAGEAVYNGQNIALSLTEISNVSLKIDLTGYDHSTKNGATYSVTVTPAEGGETTAPTEPEIPEGDTAVTLHFMKPDGWGSSINAYLWSTSGGDVDGYGDYNAWPGKAVSDTDGDGWYDLVVVTESEFNFIFNDGSNQTADLATGEVNGNKELWIVGNDVFEEQPDYTVVIHFQNSNNWNKVYAYVWNPFVAEGESNAIPGYESYNAWPGAIIEENTNNPGWYDLTITKDNSTGFNFIFNNGSGAQTGNLWSDELSFHTELWVVGDTVDSTAPTGWSNPDLKVYVPGTFPGPSWDAASNQMTYDAELGLYVYTFENVIKGTYEYKIAINGSWNENYGANGEPNGDNIKVVVPSEQDVTIWYNASSHRTVCSVYYDMGADITLSGTGVAEGTKLTDPELTGNYSVTVNLSAGTYSDLKVTYNGEDYSFTEFTMETGKDVTFWFDPSTGLAYHNGSDVKVETDKIYYTTKDLDYKDPFGAVATDAEVTFSIDTGIDATAVNLVVKGYPATGMTKDGEPVDGIQHWTCTTSFDSIGEYEYYFAITNGSDMVFYCDDIWNNYYKTGDYGQGGIGNPDDIFAYDLVVYEAGFETPDWMKNAVIYQIFPDRFFDGDEANNLAQTWARGTVDYEYVTDWYMLPENPEQKALLDEDTYKATGAYYGDGEYSNEIYGGDLEGIIDRIDYLKALGVNVIYLNPVFWSISNHRYDAVSYTEIDPILGTLGDFEELVAVAEANDMHIILDGVFNHVSDDSVYFDRYYKFLGTSEKIGAYPYWAYVYDYMAEQGVDQETAETAAVEYFTAEYGITDYSYTEWFAVSSIPMTGAVDTIGLREGKPVYSYEGWWGYDSMPVIYSTNGSEYQTGNWAEEIIYNEEETAVTQYWISKGSNGWRLDVANEVSDETWQNFRDSVKALDSDAVIIGEIWADATRYLMGDMYDSVMNYVFRDAVAGFARGYLINRDNKAENYDSDLTADEAMTILEILRERYPEEAFYAMMNLVASHDTSRILSYLDDVEDDRYQKDLESAFPTYEGTSDEAKQLQYVVSFLQFTYPGAPTIYYGDEIGMVGGDDPDDRRAFTWGKGNQDIVEWYAQMAAIRAAYPALRTGSVEPFSTGNDDVVGFVRADADNTLVVLANRAATAQTVAYEGTWVDLISGETFTDTITIPAYRGVILVAEDEVKEITVDTDGLAPAYDESYIVAERDPNGHSHEYTDEVTTEATCTSDGVKTYTCSCGDSYTETIPATGHNYESVVTDPTCTERGYTTHTCACGDSYVDNYVDATGHKDVVIESEEATCELNGYEYHACENCGGNEYTIILEATGHNYEDGVCTNCGEADPDAGKPSTGSIFDKIKDWLDSIFNPKPGDPSEPTDPSEPGKPEKPGKPGWGGWFDWWPFW